MSSLPVFLVSLVACASVALAQAHAGDIFDPNNRFFVPPPAEMDITIDPTVFSRDQVYTVGQPTTFTWITNVQSIRLVMYQQGITGNQLVLADSINSTGTITSIDTPNEKYEWNGSVPFDFNQGRIFFLDIYDLSNSSYPKFRSHYFNITDAPPPPPPTPSNITNNTCVHNSCSSNKAVAIGAGVGGGVGGALLIAFAIFLFWKFHKKGKQDNRSIEQQRFDAEKTVSSPLYHRDSETDQYASPSPVPQKPVELPIQNPIELPSHPT